MFQHLYKGAILFIFATLISCSKSPVADFNTPIPIDFSVQDYTADVKGSEITTDNISSFGVFAALENDAEGGFNEVAASELELYMDNVPVMKNKSNNKWLSDPPYYWPKLSDKSLSFFAYAPYSQNRAITVAAGWGKGAESDKKLKISYTSDSNPANHLDLCVAEAVLDRTRLYDRNLDGNPDPIAFNFHHTLASVSFAANYKGDLPEGCYLRIDELTVGNLLNSNILTFPGEGDSVFEWAPVTSSMPRTVSYNLSIGALTLLSYRPLERLPDKSTDRVTYTDFVTDDGVIYALPQPINPSDNEIYTKIDVTFSYVKNDSHDQIAQFYTSINLPVSTLQPACQYKYVFTLDVTNTSLINIACVNKGSWIVDWKNSNNSHSDTFIK